MLNRVMKMQMIVLFQLMTKYTLHVDDTFYYNLANNDSLVLEEVTTSEDTFKRLVITISLPFKHMMG